MVIKINRKREGTVDRASNQITAQLGNTINGTPNDVNGVSPADMKKQIDVLSDMQAQSNVTNGPSETAGMEQASGNPSILNPQGQLGQSLQGQGGVDLSKVPQDQKDFLLQNMMLLNGQKK